MRQYAHVDMDAFYVSVELLDRPELRGKPVVVGAAGTRGVVAAASYEARAFGIHSAMPMRRAEKLCKDLVILPGNYSLYEKWSKRVKDIFQRFTPVVHMTSVDEGYLDLTGTERLLGSAWQAAQKVQQTVWEETGLPCSIGLGQSCVVSKVASNLAKPRGILWVLPGEEAVFLAPLPVGKIPGIGGKTQKALEKLGVCTVGDLAGISYEKLEAEFGQWGEGLYRKARGQDGGLWFFSDAIKSLSHERTFDEDVGDAQRLEAALSYLAGLVGQRLRKAKLFARTVTLRLRYSDFETLARAHTLAEPTDLDGDLFSEAVELLHRYWDKGRKVRLLGIAASQLVEAPAQLSLLDQPERDRREKLAEAADAVRDRYGEDAIRPAKSMLRKPSKHLPPIPPSYNRSK